MNKLHIKYLFYCYLFLVTIVFASCSKILESGLEIEGQNDGSYAADFNFRTTETKGIVIKAQDNYGDVLKNIPISVHSLSEGEQVLLTSGITTEQGEYYFQNDIGNHIDSLVISTNYIGLVAELKVAVDEVAGKTLILGGEQEDYSSGRVDEASSARVEANGFTFMGSYDSNGRPHYLEPVNDHISQDLLDMINVTLPERRPVHIYNPEYIADTISADTRISEEADIWITFVHEGAGYRNALGYYSYDLNSPPSALEDIDSLKVIFPNLSFPKSGGTLSSGSKVYLGRFPANTGLGFFLVPNGWTGSTVQERSWAGMVKYSFKDFNDFTDAAYRSHTVLLKDPMRNLLLMGMEDLDRPGGDNDFNDAVFYITASSFEAIETDDLVETKTEEATDTDGDGVADENDDYPNDANKAFDVFTPGENVFGSVAFEDMWPENDDFDVNDMIVDYNFQNIADVAQNIVEINAVFRLRAMGATKHNGFGFVLPIAPENIESITGQDVITGDEVVLSANGTEEGQSESVILVFEDGFRAWSSAPIHANTVSNNPYVDPKEFSLVIKLANRIPQNQLGYAPYNPFIFDSNNRNVEVHLANHQPTDKADQSIFGSLDDNSDQLGCLYKNKQNLPFAFYLPIEFEYPEEGYSINHAFLKFDDWATSSGINFEDWYIDYVNYRDEEKVYRPN